MSLIYPGGDAQVTPNLGLATFGMDEVLAENMILLDAAIGSGSSSVKVNSVTISNPNFNNTTPAAPGGNTNVKFQVDGSGNVSAYAANGGGTPGGSNGDVQYNNSGVFGGSVATITAAGALTLGTSPAGVPTLYVANGATELGTTVGSLYTPLEAKLTVIADSSVLTLPIEVHSVNAQSLDCYVHSSQQFQGAVLNFFRTRGTQAAPTDVLDGDTIGFHSYGSGVTFNGTATLTCIAEENFGPSNSGGSLLFEVTPIGTNASSQFLTLNGLYSVANFQVPVTFSTTQTPDAGISRIGAASLAIGNGTAGSFTGSLKLTSVLLGSNSILEAIPGGNTVGGLYLPDAADWSGLLPPGNPANIGINLWIKGSGTKDTYLILQAGQSPNPSRDYIAFVDYDGSYKWLMGKNGNAGTSPNQFILYDAVADIHRIVGNSAANGTGGNTYIAAGGTGSVIINGNDGVSDKSCTGGFQVWGQGTNGTNATSLFIVKNDGTVQYGAGSTDTGLSRGAAGVTRFGNGTLGDFSGTVQAASGVFAEGSANTVTIGSFSSFGTQGLDINTAGVNPAISGSSTTTILNAQSRVFLEVNGVISSFWGGSYMNNLVPVTFGASFSSPDLGFSRVASGATRTLAIGNGTAGDTTGNISLNRINKGGVDFAGQVTITAGNTTQAVSFAANYTGTGQPVICLTPTSDPLAAGVPVGYWVTYGGAAGAWTGFTVNIQTALAGNIVFNYIVVGQA
jgi:hypothetical protein